MNEHTSPEMTSIAMRHQFRHKQNGGSAMNYKAANPSFSSIFYCNIRPGRQLRVESTLPARAILAALPKIALFVATLLQRKYMVLWCGDAPTTKFLTCLCVIVTDRCVIDLNISMHPLRWYWLFHFIVSRCLNAYVRLPWRLSLICTSNLLGKSTVEGLLPACQNSSLSISG